MNISQSLRFFPRPILWIGIAAWIVLTDDICFTEISSEGYGIYVTISSYVLMSIITAPLIAWVMLMLTLIFNGGVTSRREMFRKQLAEWTGIYIVVTIFGVLALFIDS